MTREQQATIVEVLLSLRAHGYRVRSIEADAGSVKLELDDLVIDGSTAPPKPEPRSAHEAFARSYGIPYTDMDTDSEDDGA